MQSLACMLCLLNYPVPDGWLFWLVCSAYNCVTLICLKLSIKYFFLFLCKVLSLGPICHFCFCIQNSVFFNTWPIKFNWMTVILDKILGNVWIFCLFVLVFLLFFWYQHSSHRLGSLASFWKEAIWVSLYKHVFEVMAYWFSTKLVNHQGIPHTISCNGTCLSYI